ncbi:MAG TPA: branched-chain amino acid ABC transporter permease [Syntrophorhabdus sp.]|jgi:branched-chain amino acid transport system permease protein|nr:branched-chain amino acid ABC transporter permease [Syntrophorhabdus sp.]MDI9558655.1 branched-chain amino acid ABC transporter permease [Pseudomonadota bacterium]OPX95719.1 MAG: High-affinity branched-chain amino acid transport system permease protein LivH [Syntrophorhabdus sp. PtaB.Bin027]OQB76558.1 MAG: High-affinity branched-chain amino acid transport system permease protein LivH [Deltaproteobacteria bacterium ADurb.Bin135]MBP8744995.1 branched-chain amino acid ABC transporter permease [
MRLFLEQLLNGIAMGSIYALVTLGLALVYGILRILHVAHAAVYTIGAYAGLLIFNLTGSLLLAFPGAMVVCAIIGVIIERFVYFPLLKYPPFVPLIASIAILLCVEEACRLVAGPYILTFPAKLPFPDVSLGGINISSTLLAVYAITAVVLLILWYITTKTELGLAMRAASQDIEISGAMGINSHFIVSITFVIGSAVAAVAGILVGIYYNQVYPTMGAVPAYKTLALIVVGGLGSVPGAVVASLLLGMAETLLIGYANIPLPRDALAFIAMIGVLMWRSEGLLGSSR